MKTAQLATGNCQEAPHQLQLGSAFQQLVILCTVLISNLLRNTPWKSHHILPISRQTFTCTFSSYFTSCNFAPTFAPQPKIARMQPNMTLKCTDLSVVMGSMTSSLSCHWEEPAQIIECNTWFLYFTHTILNRCASSTWLHVVNLMHLPIHCAYTNNKYLSECLRTIAKCLYTPLCNHSPSCIIPLTVRCSTNYKYGSV